MQPLSFPRRPEAAPGCDRVRQDTSAPRSAGSADARSGPSHLPAPADADRAARLPRVDPGTTESARPSDAESRTAAPLLDPSANPEPASGNPSSSGTECHVAAGL